MTHIYHITSRAAALQARESGEYRTESLASQGFIHFSQIFQTLNVANAFYAGQTDLVILVVDVSRLKAELKFEAPVHPSSSASAPLPAAENLFPHLYGPLNFDAVIRLVDFPAGPDGRFELPALE
jgi:uncharacterized protein (DUF952 family)